MKWLKVLNRKNIFVVQTFKVYFKALSEAFYDKAMLFTFYVNNIGFVTYSFLCVVAPNCLVLKVEFDFVIHMNGVCMGGELFYWFDYSTSYTFNDFHFTTQITIFTNIFSFSLFGFEHSSFLK